MKTEQTFKPFSNGYLPVKNTPIKYFNNFFLNTHYNNIISVLVGGQGFRYLQSRIFVPRWA